MNTPKKILIIEDEKLLIESLQIKLEHSGFNVLTASDGKEGLKVALQNHPDLILLDIIMPQMDGITMLDELRKDTWGKNAQVILLTNLSDREKEMHARAEGVDEFIIKADWDIDDIILKIQKFLN